MWLCPESLSSHFFRSCISYLPSLSYFSILDPFCWRLSPLCKTKPLLALLLYRQLFETTQVSSVTSTCWWLPNLQLQSDFSQVLQITRSLDSRPLQFNMSTKIHYLHIHTSLQTISSLMISIFIQFLKQKPGVSSPELISKKWPSPVIMFLLMDYL